MPDRYVQAIMKSLAERDYQPLRPQQLARRMGIDDADYGAFRESIKRLHSAGHIIMGAKNALTLPAMGKRVVGVYRANPKGFGFIVPETPNSHGDLFVPGKDAGGALSGDRVVATAEQSGRRDGQRLYQGRIVEILSRGDSRFVGTLQQADAATWFVEPDGRQMNKPIVIRDVSKASGAQAGQKVVVEIVDYDSGELPTGVIIETLGRSGTLEVETRAVIRAHGLEEVFTPAVLTEARKAAADFDPDTATGRTDLTGVATVTIDPPDARDYDDAITLRRKGDQFELGVHIADVSHFVQAGSALDKTAQARSTSVYFPHRVIPMIPEVLSNGVCSLQEAQKRFCKSALLTYDADGNVVNSRLAETVIRSDKRLTYVEAQQIIDGKTGGYDPAVVKLVQGAATLAKRVEARRIEAGMLHLDLPEVELTFDESGDVAGVEPADDSYTHTVIEMFMVAANEAVARELDRAGMIPLRRIHPAPDAMDGQKFSAFVRACGHRIPKELSRRDVQALLNSVRGTPASYAVNLAVLRMMQQAVYSPLNVGHFALASEQYCHFTSPIRRYPDLTVHRLVAQYCRNSHRGGKAVAKTRAAQQQKMPELVALGSECSLRERRAEAAAQELKQVLVLGYLAKHVGDEFDGVVTGVANVGMFVQVSPFGVDGLVRMADMGDDWWDVNARYGQIRGQRTGQTFRVGDAIRVQVVSAEPGGRQLALLPVVTDRGAKKRKGRAPAGAPGRRTKGKSAPKASGRTKPESPRRDKPKSAKRGKPANRRGKGSKRR